MTVTQDTGEGEGFKDEVLPDLSRAPGWVKKLFRTSRRYQKGFNKAQECARRRRQAARGISNLKRI
jgi:hypothetical protein